MTSPVTEKATKMNAWQMPESSKYLREDLVLDNGHSLDQYLKRRGILQRIVHKELGIILRNRCCWNLQKVDILPSVQQLHCPGVSSRAKDVENCRYTSLQMNTQLRQFFALPFLSISSVSTEVAAFCEEFENHQDGSGEPEILMGQSIVLGEIKAEVLLQNENPLNHQILWQQYIERIESLSPESKVSRFCKEAGFMRIVEVGQYFVTKDTGDFRQFRSVALSHEVRSSGTPRHCQPIQAELPSNAYPRLPASSESHRQFDSIQTELPSNGCLQPFGTL